MSYNELHGLTIPALLRRRAAEIPQAAAFSGHSWRGHRDRLSYNQLVHRMEMMGRAFYRRGVRHGDRVAVFLTNYANRECVLTALGCLEIGAVVVPLNTRRTPARADADRTSRRGLHAGVRCKAC
jgi:acyl-CoA synthetase (AMP-forming)/AMP-acid ligase II